CFRTTSETCFIIYPKNLHDLSFISVVEILFLV
ncbi:MAG: hypothetical protein ACI9TV_003220, partial [Sulfurimonas sp.]